MRRATLRWLFSMPLLLLAGGCDSSGDEGETSESGGPVEACTNETRAMEYSAGMQVASDGGKVMATLVEATPAPPIRDLNDWDLVFTAPDGSSLGEIDVSVEPWMPDHGHGSANPATSIVAGEGDGWKLSSLDLFMAGYWEVHFDFTLPGGEEDRVTFGFCVD